MTINLRNISNVGIQRFYKHLSYTKTVSLSAKFPEMYPDSWIYRGFMSCNFDLCQRLWWKENGGWDNDLHKKTWLKVDYLCTDGFNWEILPRGFVMQCHILKNVIIFVAYVLNLPLNTHRPHYRSQRAGKWSLILAHDRHPIYRAPTYIAVPLLGPHQPRYIESTLYKQHKYRQFLLKLTKIKLVTLTHCGQVMPYGILNLSQHHFRQFFFCHWVIAWVYIGL